LLARRGSTLIEALLAMLLVSMSLPLMVMLLNVLKNYSNEALMRQNRLGVIQLRRVLSLGHSHVVKDDELCMNYRAESTCFYLHEDKLMQTPGTQFYLIGLSSLSFYREEGWIILGILLNDTELSYGLLYDATR
jgi:hypothetical protein